MIVCVCHRVSDREIAIHVRAGLDFDSIKLELGVATQCGQCEGCARELVTQCQSALAQGVAPACGGRPIHVAAIQLARSITESSAWSSSTPLAAA